VAELKDYINTMIGNLRLTTERNTEQDWLKTNLARFTSMLQGQRDLGTVGTKLLSELVPLVDAQQGLIYQMVMEAEGTPYLKLLGKYADDHRNGYPARLTLGDGLIGQSAIEKRRIHVTNIPSDTVRIGSGLMEAVPRSLVVLPVTFEDQLKAVIALASLREFDPAHLMFLEQLTASIGIVLNSIEATMQTEGLLKQSQQLATELQTQQKELQQTNEQLAQKAQQLAEQNYEVERKNQEIEQARRALEEKATELSLTSKYKSEFLANMSHELRTPLNSILGYAQLLDEDASIPEARRHAVRVIRRGGDHLLSLIESTLDLARIEAGKLRLDPAPLPTHEFLDDVARMVAPQAAAKGLAFELRTEGRVPPWIRADARRLRQILINLDRKSVV